MKKSISVKFEDRGGHSLAPPPKRTLCSEKCEANSASGVDLIQAKCRIKEKMRNENNIKFL
jgi:hypothetical protein